MCVQCRAQIFSVFNCLQWGAPGPDVGQGTCGVVVLIPAVEALQMLFEGWHT